MGHSSAAASNRHQNQQSPGCSTLPVSTYADGGGCAGVAARRQQQQRWPHRAWAAVGFCTRDSAVTKLILIFCLRLQQQARTPAGFWRWMGVHPSGTPCCSAMLFDEYDSERCSGRGLGAGREHYRPLSPDSRRYRGTIAGLEPRPSPRPSTLAAARPVCTSHSIYHNAGDRRSCQHLRPRGPE